MKIEQVHSTTRIDHRLEYVAINSDIAACRLYITEDNGYKVVSEVEHVFVSLHELKTYIRTAKSKFISKKKRFTTQQSINNAHFRIIEDGKTLRYTESKYFGDFSYDIVALLEKNLLDTDDVYFFYACENTHRCYINSFYVNKHFKLCDQVIVFRLTDRPQKSSGELIVVNDVKDAMRILKNKFPDDRCSSDRYNYSETMLKNIDLDSFRLNTNALHIHIKVNAKTMNEYAKDIGLVALEKKKSDRYSDLKVENPISVVKWLNERDYFGLKNITI